MATKGIDPKLDRIRSTLNFELLAAAFLLLQALAHRAIATIRTVINTFDGIFQFFYFGSQLVNFGLQWFHYQLTKLLGKLGNQVEVLASIVGLQILNFLLVSATRNEPATATQQCKDAKNNGSNIYGIHTLLDGLR